MEQPTVRVVYGLTLETGKRLRIEIEQAARDAEIEILPICRYRKEGIHQYITEQQDQAALILEEGFQASSPYTEDDIIKLTEIGKSPILFLLDQRHYGTSYMKTLYLCGILNAVFMNDATGEKLVRLLLSGRTNEEARDYYGIQLHRDAQKEQAEVNSEYLDCCLSYIEDSTMRSEIEARYHFVSSRLSPKENMVLAGSLPSDISRFLDKDEVYRHYQSDTEKKGFIMRLVAATRRKPLNAMLDENMSSKELLFQRKNMESYIPQASLEQPLKLDTEEDMLGILERFRNYSQCDSQNDNKNDSNKESQPPFDSLMEFGHYLQAMDA